MSHNILLLDTARKLAEQHNFDGPSLREAIPYLEAFSGNNFVLKIGGSVLNDQSSTLIPKLVNDIVFLKRLDINVILVHGGSRQLDDAMAKRKIDVKKVNGLRVTDEEVLELANEVFLEISKEIQLEIDSRGYKGVIFDRTTGLVASKQKQPELGYVGEPVSVNSALLESLSNKSIPIVSSVTAGIESHDIGFNVNADEVASAIAKEIKADKLILMTDVDGVLDKDGKLLSTLAIDEVEALISEGVISGGMLPKVNACLEPLKVGVKKSHIINGDSADSFINEILTNSGVGTEFIFTDKLQNINGISANK